MEGCQSPRLDWTCKHCDAQRFACVDCGAECIADGSGNELCERCFRPKPKSADRVAELEAALAQTRSALTDIRDKAATTANGGAWSAGIAALCLGTLRT